MLAGMNSGVMLFRNTKWSRDFLDSIAELGLIPEPMLGQVRGLMLPPYCVWLSLYTKWYLSWA